MLFVRIVAIMAVLALLCTCTSHKRTGIQNLAEYVADESHGLRKQQTWRGITLSVDYTPRLTVARDMLGEACSAHLADSIATTLLSDYTYFRFTLSRDGRAVTNMFADDADSYVEAEDYLESVIGRDIRLVAGGRSYGVEDFVYVRGRESARGSVVVVVFRDVPVTENESFDFVFEDRFFGTGMSVFGFKGDSVAMLEGM